MSSEKRPIPKQASKHIPELATFVPAKISTHE